MFSGLVTRRSRAVPGISCPRPTAPLSLTVAGQTLTLSLRSDGAEQHELHLDGQRVQVRTYKVGEQVAVFGADGSALVTEVDVFGAKVGRVPARRSRAPALSHPPPRQLLALDFAPRSPLYPARGRIPSHKK